MSKPLAFVFKDSVARHDRAYAKGGSPKDRKHADRELLFDSINDATCVVSNEHASLWRLAWYAALAVLRYWSWRRTGDDVWGDRHPSRIGHLMQRSLDKLMGATTTPTTELPPVRFGQEAGSGKSYREDDEETQLLPVVDVPPAPIADKPLVQITMTGHTYGKAEIQRLVDEINARCKGCGARLGESHASWCKR